MIDETTKGGAPEHLGPSAEASGEPRSLEEIRGAFPDELPEDLPDVGDDDDGSLTFGTFLIGEAEFAFPASHIQEVVPFPAKVTPVPLSPDYVLGIFNLRGQLVPVMDMAALLGVTSLEPLESRKVAVIDCGVCLVGALFDRPGAVHRIDPEEQLSKVRPREGDHVVVEGVLRFDGTDRLVQQISPSLLGASPSLPQIESRLRDGRGHARKAAEKARSAIVVRVAGTEYGFDIESVVEIQPMLEVETAPDYFMHCAGLVQLRDDLVPVLDLRAALDLPAAEPSPDSRLVFLAHEGLRCAVLIDELVDTVEFRKEELLEFPVLTQSALGDLCEHVLSDGQGRDILRLDVGKLYARCEVEALRDVEGVDMRAETAEHIPDEEMAYLSFRVADERYSLPLETVREIRSAELDNLIAADDSGGAVVGMFNLRGTIVPMLDLCRRLGVEGTEKAAETLVVIDTSGGMRGLLVHQVDAIVRARKSELTDVTRVLQIEGSGALRYVTSALQSRGEEHPLMVLDPDQVAGLAAS